MTNPIPLAKAFPPVAESDWRATLTKARRGNPDTERDSALLVHQRRAGAHPIIARSTQATWRIVQRIDASDAPSAVRQIGEELAGGTTGLDIAFTHSLHPLARRLPADAAQILANALCALPERFHLRIEGADPATEAVFLNLAAERNAELVLAFDPVATIAVHGVTGDTAARTVASAKAFDDRKLGGAVVIADGRLWNAGGATEEQELGVTLATFVAHLRLLDAPERIGIALAGDADQFRGIAKLRAMRLLLARVAEIAGISTPPPHIHAETAWRILSTRDPQMNVLRATSAAFAAAVGGADSITVLPSDALNATGADALGRRLARNTQTILAEEAHLFRVADPAAGSGAIETLTAAFAEAAWQRFQAIEAEGGIVSAIGEGSLLREIAEAREARIARVATGDMKMVGINTYAEGDSSAAAFRRTPVVRAPQLVFKRIAEPFETGAA